MKNLNKITETFNVVFNDENDSNDKGFELTKKECMDYIEAYNGSNDSYFADYKGGLVSIVNNETGEPVFETEIF